MKITDINGTVTLANGVEMPYLGLGVFKVKDGEEVMNAVTYALDAGYRHIDTAAAYQNENGVGKAVQQHEVPRNELFITSKLWNSQQGYDSAIRAFHQSIQRLKTDYLDLYLIHWPVKEKYKESWKAMETLYNEGKIKAIGVSNFLRHHLDDLLQSSNITPMVNQLEFHPYLVQQELLDFCLSNNIRYEAWSPLMQGEAFEVETLKQLAQKYGKSVAQLILRWDLQKGVITIPKSVHADRIKENAQIFDFEISAEDVAKIESLERGKRFGPDPDNFDF